MVRIDETGSIIRDFELKASFKVRVLANVQNLGPAQNFEQAIRECSGGRDRPLGPR